MVEKIGHYSLENTASIYDEEAMTALELAGRTAGKVNECVDQVNQIPTKVTKEVQKQIDNGTFDKQINHYAGELEASIQESEASCAQAVNALEARVDRLLGTVPEGGTSMDAEVIDARTAFNDYAWPNLGQGIRGQVTYALKNANRSAYVYNDYEIFYTKKTGGGAVFRINAGLNIRAGAKSYGVTWEDQDNILDNMETGVGSGGCMLTLESNNSLVYNTTGNTCYIRSNATLCGWDDIPLIEMGFNQPCGGLLYPIIIERESRTKNYTFYVCTGSPLTATKDLEYCYVSFGDALGSGYMSGGYSKWEDITTNIPDNITIDGWKATIKIPPNSVLSFDLTHKQLNIHAHTSVPACCVPLLMVNAYREIVGGELFPYYLRHLVNQEPQEDNSFVVDASAIKRYMALFTGSGTSDHFLYFTDPHLLPGDNWLGNFNKYMNTVKQVYDRIPATTVICGGDWLQDSDTPAEACYKLGHIKGTTRAMFPDFINVIGNHDTNYQGKLTESSENFTGRLTDAAIKNLWYQEEGATHFIRDTRNTRFYVFDTGTENQYDANQSQQVIWFAESLLANDKPNLALLMHILDPSTDGEINRFTNDLFAVAEAFNNRTSFTVAGVAYDYSQASGKVHFCICGHAHYDKNRVDHGIPVVVTTNLQDGNVPTFDLVHVDYTNKKLSLVRIGTGADRTITF